MTILAHQTEITQMTNELNDNPKLLPVDTAWSSLPYGPAGGLRIKSHEGNLRAISHYY